jgi:hypothetical protein
MKFNNKGNLALWGKGVGVNAVRISHSSQRHGVCYRILSNINLN